MGLKGSKTEENLKAAFAGESQANRRYLYFARQADIEGYPDVDVLQFSVFLATQKQVRDFYQIVVKTQFSYQVVELQVLCSDKVIS